MFQAAERLSQKEFTEKCDRALAYLNSDEYYDHLEQSILSGQGGFGDPHSKLTTHQQFLLWKRWMKQTGLFQNRDEFHNALLSYSSFEQALQHLDSLHPPDSEAPLQTSFQQSFQQI